MTNNITVNDDGSIEIEGETDAGNMTNASFWVDIPADQAAALAIEILKQRGADPNSLQERIGRLSRWGLRLEELILRDFAPHPHSDYHPGEERGHYLQDGDLPDDDEHPKSKGFMA